jgi:hypothetical protein
MNKSGAFLNLVMIESEMLLKCLMFLMEQRSNVKNLMIKMVMMMMMMMMQLKNLYVAMNY